MNIHGNQEKLRSDKRDMEKDCDDCPEIEVFAKQDTNKNRLELIEPEFINGLGKILTFGANKYSANNWKLGSDGANIERIKGALLRHTMSYLSDDKIDVDTQESHLYHIACNLMFLDYFDRQESE